MDLLDDIDSGLKGDDKVPGRVTRDDLFDIKLLGFEHLMSCMWQWADKSNIYKYPSPKQIIDGIL